MEKSNGDHSIEIFHLCKAWNKLQSFANINRYDLQVLINTENRLARPSTLVYKVASVDSEGDLIVSFYNLNIC